jgi:hypothetical protein
MPDAHSYFSFPTFHTPTSRFEPLTGQSVVLKQPCKKALSIFDMEQQF